LLQSVQKNPFAGTITAISIISLAGFTHTIPFEGAVYSYPFTLKDPILSQVTAVGQDPVACGLYIQSRSWIYTGGYYYLGRNIPLYSSDYPPSSSTYYNYSLSHQSGNQTIGTLPNYAVYIEEFTQTVPVTSINHLQTQCAKDREYLYQRTFKGITEYLP
jgi:hypothetical protein